MTLPTYEATIGSQFEVTAEQAGLDSFKKRPTVYVAGGKTLVGKKKTATVLTKKYPASTILCEWRAAIKSDTYEIYVQESSKSSPVKVGGLTIKEPWIDALNPNTGTAGEVIAVSGTYFGSGSPKIWLESGGSKITCKIVKSSLPYNNGKSCMDPSTGTSSFSFTLPKKTPASESILHLSNKIGKATIGFSNTDYAQLTMAASPSEGGTTSPAAGVHTREVGVDVEIVATAASGYSFTGWSVEGGASVADALSAATTAALESDGTVTANFKESGGNAVLAMAVSPAGSGTTTPSVGTTTTVNVGTAQSIIATAAAGYAFSKWSASANAVFANDGWPETTVTLTGDATVTAAFTAVSPSAVMTMAVSPSGSGTTTPAAGSASTVTTGQEQSVVATAGAGYAFFCWTATGDASIKDSAASSTSVTLRGDSTITAVFVKSGSESKLTMAASPAAGGTTSPAVGTTTTVATGAATSISATAVAGYSFSSWSASANATFADATAASTTVTLTGDATVTAIFSVVTHTVTFTAGSNGSVSGTTSQTVAHGSDCSAVTAVANTNYHFVNWTGDGFTTSTDNPLTVKGVASNLAVTANFARDTASLTMAVSPSAGGSTSPTSGSTTTVNTAEAQAITAAAAAGHTFTSWSASPAANASLGGSTSSSTTVTLSGSATVTANFTPRTHIVTFTAGSNGSVSGTTSQTVNYGSDCSAVTAVANTNYHFVNWTGDGFTTSTDNPLTVKGVTANMAGHGQLRPRHRKPDDGGVAFRWRLDLSDFGLHHDRQHRRGAGDNRDGGDRLHFHKLVSLAHSQRQLRRLHVLKHDGDALRLRHSHGDFHEKHDEPDNGGLSNIWRLDLSGLGLHYGRQHGGSADNHRHRRYGVRVFKLDRLPIGERQLRRSHRG